MIWHPLLLSLQVTAVATALMVLAGLPLALLLARRRFRGATLVEALVNLPLVLPPTVVGYYLLLALGRGGPAVEWFGWRILFTWGAAAIASAVVGLPLLVQSAARLSRGWIPPWRTRRARWVLRSRRCCGASPCRWRGAAFWPAWCWPRRGRWASLARR